MGGASDGEFLNRMNYQIGVVRLRAIRESPLPVGAIRLVGAVRLVGAIHYVGVIHELPLRWGRDH